MSGGLCGARSMFTVIVHIHSLSSQFFHKSRFQLYSTCHDERAAHANHNLAFSFTSPAENQDGWCGDYMEYGPNYKFGPARYTTAQHAKRSVHTKKRARGRVMQLERDAGIRVGAFLGFREIRSAVTARLVLATLPEPIQPPQPQQRKVRLKAGGKIFQTATGSRN